VVVLRGGASACPHPDGSHQTACYRHAGARVRAQERAAQGRSVHDVERVTQGFIEAGARDFVEVADGLVVQGFERDRDDVVAADDARFGEAVLYTDFHF